MTVKFQPTALTRLSCWERKELTNWVVPQPGRPVDLLRELVTEAGKLCCARCQALCPELDGLTSQTCQRGGNTHIDPSGGASTGALPIERICQMQWGLSAVRH